MSFRKEKMFHLDDTSRFAIVSGGYITEQCPNNKNQSPGQNLLQLSSRLLPGQPTWRRSTDCDVGTAISYLLSFVLSLLFSFCNRCGDLFWLFIAQSVRRGL